MMAGETKTSPLDALAPGDATGLPADQTIEFCGATFHVQGFIGDKKSGVLLIGAEPADLAGGEIASRCFLSAANVLVMLADWSKGPPSGLCQAGMHLFEHHFTEVLRAHTAVLASRGKPS